jgi:predicted phage terminase large subunit-like protein
MDLTASGVNPAFAREMRYQDMPPLEEVERELRRKSLTEFTKVHWPYVDPAPYKHGRHIDCVNEHLEAVTAGQIRRIVINIPPGHMKSISTSVMWPAWTWMKQPTAQWLFASYAQTLSRRDSIKCRTIITDPLYQDDMSHYFPSFKLKEDQNTQDKFTNNYNGYRIAASSEGMLTGEGARDYLVIDDPHNVMQGESETVRNRVVEWFRTSFLTRARDPEVTRIVIIMQRVHEKDVAGVALSEDLGFEHLCLPARCDGRDRVNTSLVNWHDWRTKKGEPLWSEHYNEKSLKQLEEGMGVYAVAGQLQQDPAPREGGMYEPEKLQIVKSIDRRKIVRSVRYWDKAGTQGGGCDTAGVLLLLLDDGRVVIDDAVYGKWGAHIREQKMQETASYDRQTLPPRGPLIVLEQEPGSGGKDSAVFSVVNLRGYRVKADKVTGSKEDRAEPFASQVNMGVVLMREAPWNDKVKSQLQLFPRGDKDVADALSGAFNFLVVRKLKRASTFGHKQSATPFADQKAIPGQPIQSLRKEISLRVVRR